MSRSLYQVTRSEVDTVKVGSYLIDRDTGKRQAWTVYQPVTGRITSFGGVRTHRLCEECLDRPTPLVRVYGHDHPHGEGPMLDPAS
jgi:hypothetical protein